MRQTGYFGSRGVPPRVCPRSHCGCGFEQRVPELGPIRGIYFSQIGSWKFSVCFGRCGLHTGLSGCRTGAFNGFFLTFTGLSFSGIRRRIRWRRHGGQLSLFRSGGWLSSSVPTDVSPVPSDGSVNYCECFFSSEEIVLLILVNRDFPSF